MATSSFDKEFIIPEDKVEWFLDLYNKPSNELPEQYKIKPNNNLIEDMKRAEEKVLRILRKSD